MRLRTDLPIPPGEVRQAVACQVKETNVTVVKGNSHNVVVVIGYRYSVGKRLIHNNRKHKQSV